MTIRMVSKSFVFAAAIAICSAATSLAAQPVLLQISPHAGDTLNVRLNQKVEMSGTPTGCPTGYSAPKRNARITPETRLCTQGRRQMTTVMEVFSRAVIHKSDRGGTLVTAVTDSIRTSISHGGGKSVAPARVKTDMDDEIDMRVATDGGVEVIDTDASDELRAVFGQMPAVLSRKPVSPGDTWRRQMRIPIAGETGATGLVTATFELDSIGRNGDIAYISMRGVLAHDHRDGSLSELSGSLNGTMQLDRRLAWITDTHATIDATSTVQPPEGGTPMVVHTRVTQQLKAFRLR
jgi:hypothetical protein